MTRVLYGGLLLGILYAVVQPYGADKASQAGKVAQGLLQRVMAASVAGVPNRAGYVQSGTAAPVQDAPSVPATNTGPVVGGPIRYA